MLRSGYALKDLADFAGRIERMLRLSLGVDISAEVRFSDENNIFYVKPQVFL